MNLILHKHVTLRTIRRITGQTEDNPDDSLICLRVNFTLSLDRYNRLKEKRL